VEIPTKTSQLSAAARAEITPRDDCGWNPVAGSQATSLGLKTVMPVTRSKSASLVARKEMPYSRMQATIIESFVKSPKVWRSDCAVRRTSSFTGTKSRLSVSRRSTFIQ
jgi:hypothetical protein